MLKGHGHKAKLTQPSNRAILLDSIHLMFSVAGHINRERGWKRIVKERKLLEYERYKGEERSAPRNSLLIPLNLSWDRVS